MYQFYFGGITVNGECVNFKLAKMLRIKLASTAVQRAKEQWHSLRAIARKLGMSRVAVMKYASAESPPTKKLSAEVRAKAEALARSLMAAD